MWRQFINHCAKTNEILYSKISLTYLQVLFESLVVYETTKYGDGAKFVGYVGTNIEPHCV
jgi:hypothetical protein